MQRLFSMFPTGRAGAALLLMRIAVAIMLMSGVALRGFDLDRGWLLVAHSIVATMLVLGLLTPVSAVLCVFLEVANGMSSGRVIEAIHVCAILSALALGMVGPGGYSVDARLFGRRKLRIGPRQDDGIE